MCGGGFNPRPRTGGDGHGASRNRGGVLWFQSTPPHGGRRRSFSPHLTSLIRFNPRPRTGGDVATGVDLIPGGEFQSTPPHGGRHNDTGRPNGHIFVSIHAPARGATDGHWEEIRQLFVSIHAPARGATIAVATAAFVALFQSTPPHGGRPLVLRRPYEGRFNPRPRTGGDVGHPGRWRGGGRVSIHAPARGATRIRRSGRGCMGGGFNPRPRTGGDVAWVPRLQTRGVSIHAPARGATQLVVA